MENYIYYKVKGKYQLSTDYEVQTRIETGEAIDTPYIKMSKGGTLKIMQGYVWDGPSGPVVDTDENMRAALVHDALYQLMRGEFLSLKDHRKDADKEFRDICVEDGVAGWRASVYYWALRRHGKRAASPKSRRTVHRAPADFEE